KARANAGLGIIVGKKPAAAPQLGRHMHARRLAMRPDPALAQATAINVRRIPEADARRIGGIENGLGRLVTHRPEIAAQLPAAQSDFGDLVARLAQPPRLHACLLLASAAAATAHPVTPF